MKFLRTGLNEDYFKQIDSEEKAYFLGFIVADGCIVKDKDTTIKKAQNRLVISIQNRDGYILEIINNRISPYKKLQNWTYVGHPLWSKRVTFKINSNKLCNDLETLGVTSMKSGNEQFPIIDKLLMRHFVRGYFDGDGCCYVKTINKICKHGGKLKVKVIFTCLNEKFLEELQKELEGIGIIKKIIKKGNRQDVFQYTIENKKDVPTFFHYIYNNSNLFLKRKYEKFLYGNPELINIIINVNSVETSS